MALCSHGTWYLTHHDLHRSEPSLSTSVCMCSCVQGCSCARAHGESRGQHQLSPAYLVLQDNISYWSETLEVVSASWPWGPKDLPARLHVPSSGVTSLCHCAWLFPTLNLVTNSCQRVGNMRGLAPACGTREGKPLVTSSA